MERLGLSCWHSGKSLCFMAVTQISSHSL